MENLEFTITIEASAKKVWETMLGEATYKDWVQPAWPGSFYKGTWAKDEHVRFIGDDGSGTLAEITAFKPYESLTAVHIAILLKGGMEDRESDMAKGWMGTTEKYSFTETGNTTKITVILTIQPEWADMFNNGWPKALDKLKEMCEQN